MYDFYYNHLKLRYGTRCDLLYTDTDSLLLDIKTDDVYKDMENRLDELYDTSDYPKDHFLYSQENKNKCAGRPISDTVYLRSKMYSISLGGNSNKSNNSIVVIKKAKVNW